MTPAARVVPDVASFSVDDGFWYSIPEHLSADLRVGSIVRIPLSGRRVRGWVVQVAERDESKLKDIAGISGILPVCDTDLLEGLLWAARHYVAPVSALLARATPPNLPRKRKPAPDVAVVEAKGTALGSIARRAAAGRTSPATAIVSNWRKLEWLADLGPVFEAGKSVLLVAATAAEASFVASNARLIWGDLVAAATGDDAAGDTSAWTAAQSAPRLLITTPKGAAWHVEHLGLVMALEESRRAMKDRQTPTLHVRDLLLTRSRIEGFNLVFYGPTPGVELLAGGAEVVKEGNRAWPLVEVVDRSSDAPGSGFLSSHTVAAISATVGAGRKVFVFTHRRASAASARCAKCRSTRTCRSCGRRLGLVEACPRCDAQAGPCTNCGGAEFEAMGTVPERLVAELNRRVSHDVAAVHPTSLPVGVGTERDLAGLDSVAVAVAADVDGMLLGSGYRTTEEALRQLARLASVVGTESGSRLILQTSRADSLLITTMRRGDPIPYLERVLVERAREGFPPSTELVAVEVRGDAPADAGADLSALGADVILLGPMPVEGGQRWLLTGKLGRVKNGLRSVVGRWRDKGATVRVDADPIDL